MPATKTKIDIFHGNFVHTPSFGELEYLIDTYIGVINGKIVFIEEGKSFGEHLFANYDICIIHKHYSNRSNNFFVPSFIDVHTHAPQYIYTGTATDTSLMQWLNEYAFPAETSLKTKPNVFAYTLYKKLVRRLICNGISTVLYFGTIDIESNLILAEVCDQFGMRAFIGKVCMDRNSPLNYCETLEESLANTEIFLQKIGEMNSDLISAAITPRFIPCCTDQLMIGLSVLANKYNCQIQSHISESNDEMQFVRSIYEQNQKSLTDAQIFDNCQLLTDKCVMAHAVHCTPDDWELLALRKVSIAHCPLSNAFFANGALDVMYLKKHYSQKGLKIGLGLDIAGGYSCSMMNCMRQAVITSKMIHTGQSLMNFKHALYFATVGGAQCLNIEEKVGLFQVGMQFDAILFDVDIGGNIDIFADTDSMQDIFQKLMNLGDDRNIVEVLVQGKRVLPFKQDLCLKLKPKL